MKRKITILIISIVSISLAIFVILFTFFMTNNCGIVVDGEISENNYNNFILNDGDLARVGNKLFYNYDETNNVFNYGLYEISKSGKKKIVSPGIVLDDVLCSMQSSKGSLSLIDHIISDNKYSSYNLKDESFSDINIVNSDFDGKIQQFFVFKDRVYIVTDLEVLEYYNNSVDKLLDRSSVLNMNEQPYCKQSDLFLGLYFTYDKVYYIDAESRYLSSFDVNTHKTDKIMSFKNELKKVKDNGMSYQFMIVDNNYVIFSCDSDFTGNLKERIYFYDIESKVTKKIDCEFEFYACMNSLNDQLVLGSVEEGLFLVDLKDNKRRKLGDWKIEDVYVVDNKYIYFKDNARKLSRINPHNGKVERVYY